MAQYAVLIHSPAPADPMEITPDYLAPLDRYPAQVAELGGTIVTGFALQPSTTATAVRGDLVTDGPFIEAKEVVAGVLHPGGARPGRRPENRQAEPGHHRRRRRGPAALHAPGRVSDAGTAAAERAVADAHRREWAFVLAATARWPSPVVALNRAVAVSMVDGPATALVELDAVAADPRLAGYHYLPAIRADLLRRLDRPEEAAEAYQAALALVDNDAERAFLTTRLTEITAGQPG